MTMTDPIADMLTRIRNANVAMHDEDDAVVQAEGGAGCGAEVGGLHRRLRRRPAVERPEPRADHRMKCTRPSVSVSSRVQRVSKPGLRHHQGEKIPGSSGGLGVAGAVHQPGPDDRPGSQGSAAWAARSCYA